MSLKLSGAVQNPLLGEFLVAYKKVYQYEYAFAAGGLDGFNQQFGDQIEEYEAAQDDLIDVLERIKQIE